MNILNIKSFLVFSLTGLLPLCGCLETMSYERSILLLPPAMENADSNNPPPEPVDPLDVLAAVEKIAAKAGLKPYTTGDEEASLLDIADSDLSGNANTDTINVTEWKHPDLPVYLTVTRKSDEILILLNHTPDASGKPDPDAVKLYKMIEKQLTVALAELRLPIE